MPDWTPALRARLEASGVRGIHTNDLVDELSQHLDDFYRDQIDNGMPAEDALRATLVELERASLMRAHLSSPPPVVRSSGDFRLSWIDLKLGVRIWLKHPALSIVSVLGLALATAIGAAYFAGFGTLLDPSLPLDDGHRIVAVQIVDSRSGNTEERMLHQFVTWRNELQSISDLAAMRVDNRNLLVDGRATQLVRVAAMTASGFQVARVAPVLGRTLAEDDERPGASPVVMISEEMWETLFERDPNVLNRSVRLGSRSHSIVGVMPAGFRFPLGNQLWTALPIDPRGYEPQSGPAVTVFGRLADGVSFDVSQSELTARSTVVLRAQVLPYTYPFNGLDNFEVAWWVRVAQFAIGLLVAVVAVNVAILVYARTTARAGEIAVRTALGASRRRVVLQLFVEGLVMSTAAAALGLAIAAVALDIAHDLLAANPSANLPFWVDLGLSPGTAIYVGGLAIMVGLIVGVVPGLEATGRRMRDGLQHVSSHTSALGLGRLWTTLIVVQVAIAVAVLPFALYVAATLLSDRTSRWDSADAVLTGSLAVPSDGSAIDIVTYRNDADRLLRELSSDPGVTGVAFAARLPGYEGYARFDVPPLDTDATGATDRPLPSTVVTRLNLVDADLFDVLDVRVLEGRGLTESDAHDHTHPILVNRAFVDRVLAGQPSLDRRIRRVLRITRRTGFPDEVETGPWLRIVGVLPDATLAREFPPTEQATVYQPVPMTSAPVPLQLAVRVKDAGRGAAEHLRSLTSAVDPEFQLGQLRTVAEVSRNATRGHNYVGWAVAAVTTSVLLLSAAGIYAMTSFTVARRRREIGIRTALGASPHRLLGGIFARAGAQLGAGVLVGLVIAFTIDRLAADLLGDRAVMLFPVVAAVMVTTGLLAALGPARRGLAVQPTDALREN